MIHKRFDADLNKMRYFFGDDIEILKNRNGKFYYKTLKKVEMPYAESFGYAVSVHEWDTLKGLDLHLSDDNMYHVLEGTDIDRNVEVNLYNKDLTLQKSNIKLNYA